MGEAEETSEGLGEESERDGLLTAETSGRTQPTNNLSPDAEAHLSKMLEHLESAGSYVLEIHKARQSFYDRLIILNGATLTFLFSILGVAREAPQLFGSKNELGRLILTGCWLLVASIICCLIHNQTNIAFLMHAATHVMVASTHGTARRFWAAVGRIGLTPPEQIPESDPSAAKAKRNATVMDNMCRILGPFAQLLTIAAYVQFIRALTRLLQRTIPTMTIAPPVRYPFLRSSSVLLSADQSELVLLVLSVKHTNHWPSL